MADRESKIELWVTWDDSKQDHPEGWDFEFLLGGHLKDVGVNRVKITDVEDE